MTPYPTKQFPVNHNRSPAQKRTFIGNMLRVLFSPASAFAFAFFGYYTFAGFVNVFMPNGSLGGILIRTLTLAILMMTFLVTPRSLKGSGKQALVFISLFFVLYTLRIVENIYFLDINFPQDPVLVFMTFLLEGILTGFILSSLYKGMQDRHLIITISVLCFLFLIGMVLNLDTLVSSAKHRMRLDKINPISMAHLSFAFLFYYLLVFSLSKRLKIEAALFVPPLVLIILYAQSRGALLAGGATIAIYIMLLKGSKRLWMILGIIISLILFLAVTGTEQIDLIFARFASSAGEGDVSTQLHYQAWQGAWHQFMEDFAFGRYIIEMSTEFYPHNILLESFMSVGLLGTIPFIIHLSLATRAAVGIIRSRIFSITPVLISLLYFREIIAGMFAGSLWGAKGVWVTSMLVITFWYNRPRIRRNTAPFATRPPLQGQVYTETMPYQNGVQNGQKVSS